MKAKVTNVSAWQSVPLSGTLDISIPQRYVDSDGNATVRHYSGVLNTNGPGVPRWVNAHNPDEDLWLVVQGPVDPAGPLATFNEILSYGPESDVRTSFTRRLVSSDLDGLFFDYAQPAPVNPAGFGGEPLTMLAARQLLAYGPALAQATETFEQVLADTEQSAAQFAQTAGIRALGRAPQAGDPVGIYRHIDGSNNPIDIQWNGTAVTGTSNALTTLAQMPEIVWDLLPRLEARKAGLKASNTDNSGALQAIINEAAARVVQYLPKNPDNTPNTADPAYGTFSGLTAITIPPGRYKFGTQLFIPKAMKLVCDHPKGAWLEYTGTDYAIVVNSQNATSAAAVVGGNVRAFEMEGITVTAVNGSGIKIGSNVNYYVRMIGCAIRGTLGKALEIGRSVYFARLEKLEIINTGGVSVKAESDLVTFDQCIWGQNHSWDLDVETTTPTIINCDFETNNGPQLGMVIFRTSDVEAGRGIMAFCRFGPESGAAGNEGTLPPYDIVISAEGKVTKTLRAMSFLKNRHFSRPPGGVNRKIAPIYLDSGIAELDIDPLNWSGYTSGYLVVSNPDNANVLTSSDFNSVTNELRYIEPRIRGLFRGRTNTNRKTMQAETSGVVDAWNLVYFSGFSANGMPAVQKVASGSNVRLTVGVAEYGMPAGAQKIHIHTVGSVIEATELDASATVASVPVYPVNSPVYLSPTTFKLTLTPGTNMYDRVIGRVLKSVVNAPIILTFERTFYSAMPTSGTYTKGDYETNSAPTVQGTAGSQYRVMGWQRLTTGSGHVAGTDWFVDQRPTGT